MHHVKTPFLPAGYPVAVCCWFNGAHLWGGEDGGDTPVGNLHGLTGGGRLEEEEQVRHPQ